MYYKTDGTHINKETKAYLSFYFLFSSLSLSFYVQDLPPLDSWKFNEEKKLELFVNKLCKC